MEIAGFAAAGFGLLQVGAPQIEISARLADADDTRVWEQYTQGAGTITARAVGDALLDTGSSTVGDFAAIVTETSLPYVPGCTQVYLWTTTFPTARTDQTALAGPYHAEAGFAVGYLPGQLSGAPGFMLRRGRRLEVQAITITGAPSGAGNITVTLDGTAHVVPLTSTSSVEDTAREIAEFSGGYADTTTTYLVHSRSEDGGTTAKVYFMRRTHGVPAGAYSVADTGGTGVTASIAQVQAGADGTQTLSAFSLDPLDGTGASGLTWDPTRYAIWLLTGGWLGALPWTLWYADPATGKKIPVHIEPWAQESGATEPIIVDPILPMTYAAVLGDVAAGAVQIGGASVCAWNVGAGPDRAEQRTRAWEANRLSLGSVGSTELPVLAVQCARIARGAVNRRRLVVETIILANVGSKDCAFKVYVGPATDLTGHRFRQPDTQRPLLIDTAATAVTPSTDAIKTVPVPSGEQQVLSFRDLPIRPGVDTVLMITAQTNTSTTTVSVEVDGQIDR